MKSMKMKAMAVAAFVALLAMMTGGVVRAQSCCPQIPDAPDNMVKTFITDYFPTPPDNTIKSLLTVTLSNSVGSVQAGQYNAWCIDAQTFIDPRNNNTSIGSNYVGVLLSTCDPAQLAQVPDHSLVSSNPPVGPNLPQSVWNQVNYILNHHAGYNFWDVQRAINSFIGGPPLPNGTDGYPVNDLNAVQELIDGATLNGADYSPSCGVIGVVLVVDQTTVPTQIIILEVPCPVTYTVNCPSDIPLGCNPTVPDCSTLPPIRARSSCSEVAITATCSFTDSAQGCAKTRTVTYTMADAATGFSTQCVQLITWTEDHQAPQITGIPTSADLGCVSGLPGDSVVKAAVTATDNCGEPTINVTHVDSVVGCTRTRTFTITAQDACGNVSDPSNMSYSRRVTCPTVSVTPDAATICEGGSVVFTAVVTGGVAPITYNWSGPSGSGPFGNTASITASVAGDYTVSVSNPDTCTSDPAKATLVVNDIPECDIAGPQSVAINQTNTYISTGSPGTTLLWSITGNGTLLPPVNGLSVQVVSGASGSYTVGLRTISEGNCTNNCSLPVTLQSCDLEVTKRACIVPSTPASTVAGCTGGAISMTIQYTGPSIASATTVTLVGNGITVTYTLPNLPTGYIFSSAAENGYTIDALAHGKSNVGATLTITINGVKEVLHVSCSCKDTPETNLKVCNPLCLDASSPDNSTGSKGPASPLWTLLVVKDPKNGVQTCQNSNNSGSTIPENCSDTFSGTDCVKVVYYYVITNKSAVAASLITVLDDKLGYLTANPIPTLGGNKSITLTATSTVCCTTTNMVTVSSAAGCTATAQAVVTKCNPLGQCTPAYPFASANPLTSIDFNESEVLRTAVVTVVDGCMPDQIRVFYNDEHALTLGIRQVVIKNKSGTITTNFPISALLSNPGSVTNPQVGSKVTSGDLAGVDLAGRPMFPALFITDITSDPSSLSGDWQYGGTAIAPHAVFGSWKGAVKTVDNTKAVPTVSVTPDVDPVKNNWNLGAGADAVPAGLVNEGFGAEIRWNVSQLGLIPGHTYRLYFMVHDGDQNKTGGDVGHDCAVLGVGTSMSCPPAPCPSLGNCTPPYPYASANPLTSIDFNESEVLRTAVVSIVDNCIPDQIRVYYNDEHALTLGIRQVVVKTKTGTITTNFPISPLLSNPGSVTSPLVGSRNMTGDLAGTDIAGRPMFPALYITDITGNPNSLAGDWQFGGTAIAPDAVYGTWKGAVRTVDKTKIPTTVTVTPDVDPVKNNWNLGPGSHAAPAGLKNEGFGAEVVWKVSNFGLLPGHTYRLYFMVHDGDQNKVGGDVGHDCATLAYPVNAPGGNGGGGPPPPQ